MIDIIERRSRQEGRKTSRLPRMSRAVQRWIRGKADFLGLNYYTSRIAEPADPVHAEPSMWNDQETKISVNPAWPQAKSPWLLSVPEGLREMLKFVLSGRARVI